MPRKLSNALSPLAVKNAKPGRHADGGGLHLLVKETGARSWVFRFMLKGKSRDIGLGAASGPDAVTLANARAAAEELRVKVRAGIDPLEERKAKEADALAEAQAAAIAGITFKTVAEGYIEANKSSWVNPKHRQQWSNTLSTYVYPVIGDLPVADVETAHVLQILEPLWQKVPETASRVRGRIETVLDAAKAREYRTGENPARWRGHIALLLPARSKLTRGHHPALPHERMSEFVADLRARSATAALALEFAILTAARTGEVLGATWQEIDFANAAWVIPASRMKADKEHRVPLSDRAMAILEVTRALGKKCLFPSDSGDPLSSMAMNMLLRRMHEAALKSGRGGYLDPVQGRAITVHGFRSSFRDWSDDCTEYPWEMKEMALAHTISSKAEKAYRRRDLFDKRRRMMEDWATYCATGSRASATVTPIRVAVL